ncbi:hypothetical protein BE221DRAFT_188156 [Ostreococcus tauri]|uniref:DUF6816 domain-containing protein n=2 Tax=Ostreococcus tauri TaxID=70448 RepID=A0A1Y5HYG3_OSTTA|nr:hypothetical protein BE221DRAFT_188156 [Ostreococcus tauri]
MRASRSPSTSPPSTVSRRRARRAEGCARAGDDDAFRDDAVALTRRAALAAARAVVLHTACARPSIASPRETLSRAWTRATGAPEDVTFPSSFAGDWLATATCVDVSAPLGTSYVRDIETFERERREIGRRTTYPVRFARNARGDVVFDRAFNVDALATSRGGGRDVVREIEWDIDDPNVLKLTTSDGTRVFYKITARSSARDDDARTMTTSELAEIVLDRNRSGSPSVKSTRVVTKYKWRDVDDAREGPAIVASQTVYEYLSPVGDAGTASRDDADAAFIRARGRAVSQSVHRIAMIRYPDR